VGAGGVAQEPVSVVPRGAEAPVDWAKLGSPETYLGSVRSENRVSSGAPLRLKQWALGGDWAVRRQAAVLEEANGRIGYRFHARDLNLVMAPGAHGGPVRFRVRIDGHPPGPAHGIDVDEQGNGVVAEPRMYQLIRQPGPVADRQFEIQFLDPGVEVFVFTFG
jgi:thioredoxin family protein